MKSIIIIVAVFVAVAMAAPLEEPIKIIRSDYEQKPEGGYGFNFETENGISRQENAEPKEVLDEDNKPHIILSVRGSYSYTDEAGNPESINYFADETGFHAEGPSVPKVQ